MKKISTLAFSILFSVAMFAGMAPNRLSVYAEGNANIKVTVDGNRFNQQSLDNSVIFENLQPGFHAVKVYQLSDKRGGFFGRKQADYKLVYAASVNIKPLFVTSIQLNRYGNAQVSEQPIRGGYDNRDWNNKDSRNNDRGYNGNDRNDRDNGYNNNNGYGNTNVYVRNISDQDFFAAQRVMERENFDNARLLYAKRLVDDNMLSAEQVKELTRFFSFDNSRLEFAKYAYGKTTDQHNYSVVCNAFSSASGRDQLMIFIRNHR